MIYNMLTFIVEHYIYSVVAITLVSISYFIYNSTKEFNYFSAQGINGPKPIPILGNMLDAFKLGRIHSDLKDVNTYGLIVGTFTGKKPTLLVADPEAVKTILVKEFNNFTNRPIFGSGDEVFDGTLMALRDNRWRYVRQCLAPTFTPFKLKLMNPKIKQASQQFVQNLLMSIRAGENVLEMREATGNFTMDVIASTGFGIEIDSQLQPDTPFVKHAKSAFAALRLSNPVLLSMLFAPKLLPILRFFNITMLPQDSSKFFISVVKETLKYRRTNEVDCKDLLRIMMESHKPNGGELKDQSLQSYRERGLTEELMISQALIFFLSGYDTTASTLAFLFYSLACDKAVQEKLRSECHKVDDNQEITAEMLNEMPYLDQCVQETLRMYPPIIRMTRIAKEATDIKGVHLRKGDRVAIPIYAMHHNATFWPNPEHFDPDRFQASNKAERDAFCHIPFAAGPRNCIGAQLALKEVKLCTIQALKKVRFHVDPEKTQIPLVFSRKALLTTEKGVWLKMSKI